MGMEGYQQKLLDEISTSAAASPRSNWKTNSFNTASDYNDLFGSIDPSMLSLLQGLNLKGSAGYGNNMACSPNVTASSSFGLDHSMAKAILNSRQEALAKRSQSFVDRGASPRHLPTLSSPLTSAAPSSPVAISNWGSPDGKLDWGIQGDELSKLRKPASFNFGSNGCNNFGGMAYPAIAASADEPDLSWVQHLVKDGPAATGLPAYHRNILEQQKQYQRNGGGGGADFLSFDQLYSDQERMQEVA